MNDRSTRNPTIAAVIGILLIALALLLVLRLDRLPFVSGGGRELSAEFSDSSGLERGDRVEVAGVNVGEVQDVVMGRAHVIVRFTIDPAIRLGSTTTASIRVGNLLGSKFVEIVPQGTGALASGAIPVARTTPAYDIVTAFGELTDTVEQIDTDQLGTALDTIATTFEGSSEDVHAAIRGLSQITRTIASRDEEVGMLLGRSQTLTASLDGSKADLTHLVVQANALLAEVDRRRDALRGLVIHSRQLSEELRGLVKDNQKQIGPALDELEQVTELLAERQDQLGDTVHAVAKFARVFSNTIGSGPWFDSTIGNGPNNLELGPKP
ncbi:MCE family protein [Aeromicrobium sp. A1-2]|uniref:MCE family protein n=1 Tax=Aeromicrobium sp. A1-2 TaxID=2107713 RepID=UPI0013C2A6D4|nr:MCE family protein [Aeromicrobium sp. A1-2]